MAKLYWLSSSLIFSLCITTALSRPRCGFSDVADSSGPLNFEVFDPNDPRCTPGSNCKFKNRDLTYRIKYDNKLSLSRSEVVREIARALKSWSKVTNLSFRQVFHEDAEIRISFHGNIDDFEGDDDTGLPGKNGKNYLAHAFLPRHGRLHFDINREWKTDPRKGLSLYSTALHEIGHIVGLEHSNDKSSIMWGNTEFDTNELNDDDIAGIQALYGKPVSLPSVDCEWGKWSKCREYGKKREWKKTRVILKEAKHGGEECEGDSIVSCERCTFAPGDAQGESDHYIGKTSTDKECEELVRQKYPLANGATWSENRLGFGSCWAEFNATHISDSDDGIVTCIFTGIPSRPDSGYEQTVGEYDPYGGYGGYRR